MPSTLLLRQSLSRKLVVLNVAGEFNLYANRPVVNKTTCLMATYEPGDPQRHVPLSRASFLYTPEGVELLHKPVRFMVSYVGTAV